MCMDHDFHKKKEIIKINTHLVSLYRAAYNADHELNRLQV